MRLPFEWDRPDPVVFGGALPVRRSFDDSAVVILPVPVDRTTSYVSGTRHGPHQILQSSSHMELLDQEMRGDVHGISLFTLPEMMLPFGGVGRPLNRIDRVGDEMLWPAKLLVWLAAERSITPA